MKKSIKILFVLVLSVILVTSTISLAAIVPEVHLSSTKTSVKSGDTFEVTISQKLESGATGFDSILVYNKDVFDFVSMDAVSPYWQMYNATSDKDTGEITYYFDDNGNYLVQAGTMTGAQKSGNVFKISFKVKDNYKESSEQKIAIKNIKLYAEDSQEYNVDDVSITIKVNESSDNTPTNNTPKDNTPTNNTPKDNTPTNNTPIDITPKNNTPTNNTPKNNTPTNNTPKNNTPTNNTPTNNTPTNNTPTNNTPKNNTTNNAAKNNTTNNTASILPRAGSGRGYTLLIIVGLAGISYASYMGYKKYKDI